MRRRVRDIMTVDPVSVAPETTLREVAEVLSNARISGAPVVAPGDGVVGVVSATDLVDFVATSPGVPAEREDQAEWGELSSFDAAEDDPGAGSYFVDYWEDAGADLLERFNEISGPEWNVLEEHTAAEVMSRRLVVISPDADLGEAARSMLRHGVHRLLVMEGAALAGVITGTDLLSALAGQSQLFRLQEDGTHAGLAELVAAAPDMQPASDGADEEC